MSWVVFEMGLDDSVLFLGMAIFDRYLATTLVCHGSDVLPVSVACLALAAKVESTTAPFLSDYMEYIYPYSSTYSLEQLVCAEFNVLTILDYKIAFIPTTYSIIRRMLDGMDQFAPIYVNMVFYLAELSTLEYTLQQQTPRQLAEACCCYAMVLLPQSFAVYEHLSASGLSSIDTGVATAMITLSRVHTVCGQAAFNNSPYVSTTKYRCAAAVLPVPVAAVVFDG
jgi:hypothetical protein